MKDEKKDKVYSEFLGIPNINTKKLKKENEEFLDNTDSNSLRSDILYKKIIRIEKMLYFLCGLVIVIFIMDEN